MAKYRKYSNEFKLQAAKLVAEQGYSYGKAAKQLGTTSWSIRNWVQKFRQDGLRIQSSMLILSLMLRRFEPL